MRLKQKQKNRSKTKTKTKQKNETNKKTLTGILMANGQKKWCFLGQLGHKVPGVATNTAPKYEAGKIFLLLLTPGCEDEIIGSCDDHGSMAGTAVHVEHNDFGFVCTGIEFDRDA